MIIRNGINIEYITNSFFSSRTYWVSDDFQGKFWLVDCGDVEEVVKQISAQSVIAGVPYTYKMLKRLRFFQMNLPDLKLMIQAGGKCCY